MSGFAACRRFFPLHAAGRSELAALFSPAAFIFLRFLEELWDSLAACNVNAVAFGRPWPVYHIFHIKNTFNHGLSSLHLS